VVTGNATAVPPTQTELRVMPFRQRNLAGIAAKYDPAALQARFLYPKARQTAPLARPSHCDLPAGDPSPVW